MYSVSPAHRVSVLDIGLTFAEHGYGELLCIMHDLNKMHDLTHFGVKKVHDVCRTYLAQTSTVKDRDDDGS